VWSWRPDAGVKWCGAIRAATVANKPVHRGERGVSRKPSCRESRNVCGEPVVTTLVCFHSSHTGLRVHRAPGFPCALRPKEGSRRWQNSDARCRENAESYPLLSFRDARSAGGQSCPERIFVVMDSPMRLAPHPDCFAIRPLPALRGEVTPAVVSSNMTVNSARGCSPSPSPRLRGEGRGEGKRLPKGIDPHRHSGAMRSIEPGIHNHHRLI
jgi:hypothetical protein